MIVALDIATSCPQCGVFIERMHPDYGGLVPLPDGRLAFGCVGCRDRLCRMLERAMLSGHDSSG